MNNCMNNSNQPCCKHDCVARGMRCSEEVFAEMRNTLKQVQNGVWGDLAFPTGEAEPAETPRESTAIEHFDPEIKVESQHVLATFARQEANISVEELRPRDSSSQAPVASVKTRPVDTCRTSRTTRWRRPAAKQKDTTTSTSTWSEHVVFSDRPGELPAAQIGGVVVFGRTSFCDVRTPCGPP